AGRMGFVTVEMGRATFRAPEIPMNGPDRDVVSVPLQLADGTTLAVTAVSVGNPHCVTFVDRLDEGECRRLGPLIENHPAFPNRTNVQFAKVSGRASVHIRIWARGAGYTLASGSSSCGAASAAVKNGLCDHGRVRVGVPGGELTIAARPDWSLRLDGPVEEGYRGTLSAAVAALADGFIALPGGFGTLEETFEILTWAQLGIHAKPVGVLNVGGYWDGLRQLVGQAVAEGFVRPEYAELLMFAETPAALLDRFAAWRPPDIPRAWLEPSRV